MCGGGACVRVRVREKEPRRPLFILARSQFPVIPPLPLSSQWANGATTSGLLMAKSETRWATIDLRLGRSCSLALSLSPSQMEDRAKSRRLCHEPGAQIQPACDWWWGGGGGWRGLACPSPACTGCFRLPGGGQPWNKPAPKVHIPSSY